METTAFRSIQRKAGAGSGFTEGNSWQYSWFQPQDEQGLIDLLGGDAAACCEA